MWLVYGRYVVDKGGRYAVGKGGRYVVGMWSVCGRYVVGIGRYVVGTKSASGRYVVIKSDHHCTAAPWWPFRGTHLFFPLSGQLFDCFFCDLRIDRAAFQSSSLPLVVVVLLRSLRWSLLRNVTGCYRFFHNLFWQIKTPIIPSSLVPPSPLSGKLAGVPHPAR